MAQDAIRQRVESAVDEALSKAGARVDREMLIEGIEKALRGIDRVEAEMLIEGIEKMLRAVADEKADGLIGSIGHTLRRAVNQRLFADWLLPSDRLVREGETE